MRQSQGLWPHGLCASIHSAQLPDDFPVPLIGTKLVCSRCGARNEEVVRSPIFVRGSVHMHFGGAAAVRSIGGCRWWCDAVLGTDPHDGVALSAGRSKI